MDIDNLSKAIAENLKGYTEDVEVALDKVKEELAKEAKSIVKDKAPKRQGEYKKSIAVKNDKGKWIVYAKKYQLTHLLEHGHALKNGGRSRAFPHWKPAEDMVISECTRRFKEKMK